MTCFPVHIIKPENRVFQGLEIIFRVGLAILQYNQTDLVQLDMEGMSQVCPSRIYSPVIMCMYRLNLKFDNDVPLAALRTN